MAQTAVSWYALIFVYVILGVLYLLFGVSSRKKLLKLILKCVPIIVLFAHVLSSLLVLSIWKDESQLEDSQQNKEQTLVEVSRIQLFLWGLAFSCIGDACLVIPKVAIFGILSFAISICIYIRLFGFGLSTILNLNFGGVLVGLPVFLLLIGLLVALFKQDLRHLRTKLKPVLMLLLSVYFCLISLMLWSSLLRLQTQGDAASVYGAIGALLFYISDLSIAASAVWSVNVVLFQGRVLIMTTYYGAQLFIALSI